MRAGPENGPQELPGGKPRAKQDTFKSKQRRAVSKKRSYRRAGSSPEVAKGDVGQNRPVPEGHGPRRAAVLEGREDLPLACRAVLSAYAAAGVNKREATEKPFYAAAKSSRSYADLQKLKSMSGDRRSNWILNAGSRVDAQLSFVGRALPPGSLDARRSALD